MPVSRELRPHQGVLLCRDVICCLNRSFLKSEFVFSSVYDIFRIDVTFYRICLRSTTGGFDTHTMK